VSELCLGTMYFGYRTDERTAFAILDRFLEAGGTFLDTANNYGQWHGDAGESQRVLGRWMRSRGVADRMVVATKVGARTLRRGDPPPQHWQGLTAAHIRTLMQDRYEYLGLDCGSCDRLDTPGSAVRCISSSSSPGLLVRC
jgi:aryl-alcohol dehydrogenase-like predicted oxidoreductase